MMTSIKYIILFISTTCSAFANDGAYFALGNQLIPIQETDISVQKEILHLKKINNQFIEVSVYYEFFNPKEAKELIVGFEAISPEGDVDGSPKNGQHPYMYDFTVSMNDQLLRYEVTHVADSLYNQNGKIKSIDLNTSLGHGKTEDNNWEPDDIVLQFRKRLTQKEMIKENYNPL